MTIVLYKQNGKINYYFLLDKLKVFYITRWDLCFQCCKLPSWDKMLVHEGFLLWLTLVSIGALRVKTKLPPQTGELYDCQNLNMIWNVYLFVCNTLYLTLLLFWLLLSQMHGLQWWGLVFSWHTQFELYLGITPLHYAAPRQNPGSTSVSPLLCLYFDDFLRESHWEVKY